MEKNNSSTPGGMVSDHKIMRYEKKATCPTGRLAPGYSRVPMNMTFGIHECFIRRKKCGQIIHSCQISAFYYAVLEAAVTYGHSS